MMAYSINRDVLRARMHLMGELAAGRACRWTTAEDPVATRRLWYSIREALSIASRYPEEFPALALADKAFTIHIIRPGLVEAKPRKTPKVEVVRGQHPDIPIHGPEVWGQEQDTVAPTTAQQLIDAWMAHLPSSDPLHFQQVALPIEELFKLHDWVSARVPKMMMLVGEGMITLSLLEIGMESYAWHPPEPPKKPERSYDL
jgi:hypothetical protein